MFNKINLQSFQSAELVVPSGPSGIRKFGKKIRPCFASKKEILPEISHEHAP